MKRYTRILRIYAIAGVLTLALYAYVNSAYLDRWRQTAAYSSALSFEETVRAVDNLSAALDKSLYATDGPMCARVCSEAYASASAAESAMSTLPFSTQELETLSGFLNLAGDYAHTLCVESARTGLSAEQRETLSTLSARADEFVQTLLSLRDDLNGGALRMDTREQRLRNVGSEPGVLLSARLLDYESAFEAPQTPDYDGKYALTESADSGYLTEEEMRQAAAAFLDADPDELERTYDYEGLGGRVCFRLGDTFLCVSRGGVDSLSQARLVSDASISVEQAQAAAEEFLARQGYGPLVLKELRSNGTVAAMRFARVENDAVWLDNVVSIAIALDDGSVYSFNTADYSNAESGAAWTLDADAAAATLPEAFTPLESRKVILTSDGGRKLGCYEFTGSGQNGETVSICVDASDGLQRRITVE